MSSEPLLSLQAAKSAGHKIQTLLSGSFTRWEMTGWIRRERREGPPTITHLVIPGAGGGGPHGNVLWERIAGLIVAGKLQTTADVCRIDPEHAVVTAQLGGVVHEIIRTHRDAWAVRLVQSTGPIDYWRMLLWRLKAAGSLTIHLGMVHLIEPATPRVNLRPLAVADEQTFFRLARTRYHSPAFRFPQPVHGITPEWSRGMLHEWYPDGTVPYAGPEQRHLFENGRAVGGR